MSTVNATTNDSAKRKEPPQQSLDETSTAAPAKVTPSAPRVSPYQGRKKDMAQCCNALGEEYALCNFESEDILIRIPGKLEELGIDEDDDDEINDLPSEEVANAWNSLTEEQVDEYSRLAIVPTAILDLFDQYKQEILYADERNSPGDGGFLMLNTYSSWCMYPVINAQLSNANKELNKALKEPSRSGVAKDAFKKVFAAILACHDCDHWRLDTESMEDCDKIAKKISNLLKNLLKFTDEEVGLVDPYSRKALLGKFQDISDDWSKCDVHKIVFKTPRNGQGMGRPLSASSNNSSQATTPVAKKARTDLVLAAANTPRTAGASVLSYLSGIQDKLPLRVKTNVQLTIARATEPDKNCRVVVSGATSMKKMGQLCAYLTGFSGEFHHHSQKGKSFKGSFFEIRFNGDLLWVAEKALAKKAVTEGAGHVLDKDLKIVQIFQGLVCKANSGMTFDSESARAFATTSGSVVWNSGNGQKYELKVEGILANKSRRSGGEPLPRLVTEDYENSRKKNGFGKNIHHENSYILAERQMFPNQVFLAVSPSELRKLKCNWQAKPICTADGKVEDDHFRLDFGDTTINSAGRPSMIA